MAGIGTFIIAAVVAAALGACTARPVDLTVPGRSSGNPSIAAAGPFVAVAWGATIPEGATEIYVATSGDGGRRFGSPTRVSDPQRSANLAGEQPPRVALVPREGRDPAIVVLWTTKTEAGTRLVTARSDDGGASFSTPNLLAGSEAPGNRGWQSTAVDREGRVVAVWLDHRETVQGTAAPGGMNAPGHNHGAADSRPMDGAARAQLSQLFFGSLDGSLGASAVTAGVCYCCKTTVGVGPDGAIYAAWRHVYPGNVRDIAFTVSRDGGHTFAPPVRVSDDGWVLDGCPENGPALAIDEKRRIHVVWPTLVAGDTDSREPVLALFHAMSPDGVRFSARTRLPTENTPRHPEITVGAGGDVIVAWDEQASGIRRVALGRGTFDNEGGLRFERQAIGESGSFYPVVATAGDSSVVATTVGRVGQSSIRVERYAY